MKHTNNAACIVPAYKPLVSVVVLTYQHFEHLDETLNTILSQDYPSIEVIISDDASDVKLDQDIKDEITEKFSRRAISVTFLRCEKNMGIVRHSNNVARICEGKYIKFLPHGDGFCRNDALTLLVTLAEETQAEIVTSPSLVCKGSFDSVCYRYPSKRNTNILIRGSAKKLFSKIAGNNIISAIGTIYRREFFRRGGYDSDYRHLDDLPTWLRSYRRGQHIPCVSSPTTFYIQGGLSSENGNVFKSELMRSDLIRCYEKEILPYKDKLRFLSRYMAYYRYDTLTENTTTSYYLKYTFLILYDKVKSIAKTILIKIKD